MIGMNIKELRQAKRIKQETLADVLGVTTQAVSKWETGASDPDIALLPKLAGYFGVSIDELFEVPRAEQTERIQNMIWDERRIRPETFDRTVAYLEGILKEDPKDAEALSLLAQLYNHRAHGDHENASYYAVCALEADPEDENEAWAAYLEANNARCGDEYLDNHVSAIRYIADFAERHPAQTYPQLILAENLIADRRFAEAEAAIGRLKGYQALVYRAKLAFARGAYEKAQALWEQAAGDYPTVWQAYDCLGEGYQNLGLYEKALDAYEQAFSVQTERFYTDGLFGKAQVHELMGDFAGAIEDRKRIIRVLKEKYDVTDGEEVDAQLREIERLKALL